MNSHLWGLVVGEASLLGLMIWARLHYWGRLALVWWLVGALSLAAVLLFKMPSQVEWGCTGLVLVSAIGLFAMSTGNAGTGGDEDL